MPAVDACLPIEVPARASPAVEKPAVVDHRRLGPTGRTHLTDNLWLAAAAKTRGRVEVRLDNGLAGAPCPIRLAPRWRGAPTLVGLVH